MTKIIYAAHSGWRWIALLATVVAIGYGLWGWLSRQSWNQTGRKIAMFATIALDIQLLLGLVLYALVGSKNLPAQSRFAHPLMMVLALVTIHVMSARVKRGSGDQARYRLLALGTLAALALIVAGIASLPGGAERIFSMST
jgi:hypothetical protein